MNAYQLEEGLQLHLDFHKLNQVADAGCDVLPVAGQDAATKEVLLIGYANGEALNHALEHGVATFWSTSRNKLWVKGATSGDTLELVDVRVNCEQNSLLYLVKPLGTGACHTKDTNGKSRSSCYYRSIQNHQLAFTDETKT